MCVAAGTAAKGMDGWCNGMDSDCKCASVGAKCMAPYCSFTLAKDAPAGSGAGGSSSGGTGGSSSTGSAGSSTSPSSSSDSGGCAIAHAPSAASISAGLLVGIGAIAFGARRRRRSA
jgi:hypothetical protein